MYLGVCFCFPLPPPAFIPPVPSKLWYEENPMALQMFSCYFSSFGCFWLAAPWWSFAGIPAPVHLFSHLLRHKGLSHLPRCTPRSNPGFLHHLLRSNSAFLGPSEDLSPSLAQCCIIKYQIDTKRTWWKLYSKSIFSPGLCDILLPCSPVCSCTCRCMCVSVCVGDLITVGFIATPVLAHSALCQICWF